MVLNVKAMQQIYNIIYNIGYRSRADYVRANIHGQS